jgi:hypothetical protein
VFGGGSALGRAHRLIRRMSEDIDLKIVSDDPPTRQVLRLTWLEALSIVRFCASPYFCKGRSVKCSGFLRRWSILGGAIDETLLVDRNIKW